MSASRKTKIFNGILAVAREKAIVAKPPRIIDSRDIHQIVNLIIEKNQMPASDNPNLVKLGLVESDITELMKQFSKEEKKLSQGQQHISGGDLVLDKILEATNKIDINLRAKFEENKSKDKKKEELASAQRVAAEEEEKKTQETAVADAKNDAKKLHGLCDKLQKEWLEIIKSKIEQETKKDISGIASSYHVSGNQKVLTSQFLDSVRAAVIWISAHLDAGESIQAIKDKVFHELDLDKLKEDHNLDLVKLVASNPSFKNAVTQYDAVARLKGKLDDDGSPQEKIRDFSKELKGNKELSLSFQALQEKQNGVVMSGADYQKMMAKLLQEEARLKKNYSKELAQPSPVKGGAAAIAQSRVAAIEKQIDEFKEKGTTVGLAIEITYEEASQKLKALAKTQVSTGKNFGVLTRGIFGSTASSYISKIESEIMKGKKSLVEASKKKNPSEIEMPRMRK